jgi:diacylglycerol kinase (ATP)
VNVPNLFFVIAGGDGTICSVLNYIKRIPEWSKMNPPAAVLPLGTGNDLSRTLGWGGSMEEGSPSGLIKNYDALGKTEPLDRWKMTITNNNCSIDANEQ